MTHPIKDAQLGKFRITRDLLKECEFDQMLKVFENMIVVGVEYEFPNDMLVYTAYASHFKRIEPGQKIPFYDVVVHMKIDDDNIKTVSMEWKL